MGLISPTEPRGTGSGTAGESVVVAPAAPASLLVQLAERYRPSPPPAREAGPVALATPLYRPHTKTYTGAALARRQEWGRKWAAVSIEAGKQTTTERG